MFTKEQAFSLIEELVSRFNEQYDSYKSAGYNETLTRHDFIDPFFMALGWDVNNQQGYAEAYREVIHEDKVRVSGATKAPDYSFRLPGGKRLFFVEAKKPGVVVKDEILPAYQVRRYGWSAKMPVSIITDFEEFAIYDCTKKPNPTDRPSVARIRYLTYKDYLKEFDFLWETFSKERVLKGSFDKFVQSDIRKKGTATVDKEFLLSLDNWRTYLAKSISWNNKNLDEDEINFAVQQTIDRIIFLRIAEDRNVEPYGSLQESVKQGILYQNLFQLFVKADQKYNSGIFDFNKDKISPTLLVDNKVIRTIVTELYYPESPFEFSVLPVEILGTAYEQFLGKVIRITPGHIAKVEEKPEVRKAGGVYYTPQYIVDYIVKNTVGKLVEGKTPKEISKLKIVDPACGSGSFLLGAYQYLLDWHQSYYNDELNKLKKELEILSAKYKQAKAFTKEIVAKQKQIKQLPLSPNNELNTQLKKQILLNNIYGVDLDVNAVEVTKLSLLLKCLEGETVATIQYLADLKERALPSLENNIKCGNSLIDTDFYSGELGLGFDKKIKPFNWQKAFLDVFSIVKPTKERELKIQYLKVKNLTEETDNLIQKLTSETEEPSIKYKFTTGFDVVLGNPPYLGGREWKEENGNVYEYFVNKFKVAEYQFDMYSLFWETGIKLLKTNGLIGFITPNTWLNNQSNKKLRNYVLENTAILKIVDYSKVKVFEQATVLPIITILQKKECTSNYTEIYEPIENEFQCKNIINQKNWKDRDLNILNIDLSEKDIELRKKIEQDSVLLEKLALIKFGIKLYETGKGKPPQKASFAIDRIYESDHKIDFSYRPYLEGKDINPYKLEYKSRWIKYGENLAAKRDPLLFEGERILVRRIVGNTLISAYVNSDYVTSQLLQIVKPFKPEDTKLLLPILNSTLIAYYFRKKYNRQDKTFPEIRIYELASLPIKNPEYWKESTRKETMTLVDQVLHLNEEKLQTKLETTLDQIQSKIDYCEDRINEIVYELYGLTEEEVKIVEGK